MISNLTKKQLPLSRTGLSNIEVEDLDIRDCHCSTILMSTYPQLVRHWRAVTDVEKTFYFLMEAAAAAIVTDENLQVSRICLLAFILDL